MVYVSKIVFSDGTVANVLDLHRGKEKPSIDQFFDRIKPELPLAKEFITHKTRSLTKGDRNAFLAILVQQRKLVTTKKGKKVTYYLPEQLQKPGNV